ncbi:unnamed protein product [Cylindrotheca closterium]|uniref:Uncharacterized protein n=1 Tax=Cylindrotheca closterium TaxID=2856 RepID=A0AAD2G2U7_9STRA|nr:unnamed protein product [Cylindrotheca closterium]
MDCRWTLTDDSSPLPFPQKTLPYEIHAPQSCYALVSMLTLGEDYGDDSILDESPTKLLFDRHTKRVNATLGNEERLLREKRNSSMPMMKPQRKKSMEDLAHLESALNAVFDLIIEAPEGAGCQWDCEESSIPSAAGAKWSTHVMTEVLKKPVRRSSLGYAPHSPHRSAD